MATHRFPRMLTLLRWEEELSRDAFAADRSWSEGDPEDHLHLDFSRVEFLDFGALARALLLLDAAVKSGIAATVTLPTTSVLQTDMKTDAGPTLASRRARARRDALIFMRQVGFLRSLQAPHWEKNPVLVLDRAAPGGQEPGSSPGLPESDPHNDPYQPRRVFPFRWLEPMPAAQLREAESFDAVAAGLEDLGLSRADAQTLSQTVLTELVANVAEHGSDSDGPPVALVGAIQVPAEVYGRRRSGMSEYMTEIAERALADNGHVLRLIVADSGAALEAQLGPRLADADREPALKRSRRETVLHALGLPSASTIDDDGRRKGTTGLGWVARVVRSYQGGVQARTADLLAGLLFAREQAGTGVVEEGLSYCPGTLLELTLPTGPSPPRSRPPRASTSVPGAAPRLQWLNCFFDPDRGLADVDRTRLSDQIGRLHLGQRPDGMIITVPVHDTGGDGIDDRWREATRQILKYASSIAHSRMVVVAFTDAQPHVLSPCVAAFNEELAAVADEDARNPILVLDCWGELTWCGGPAPLRAVLKLLSERGGSVDLGSARECWREADGEPARLSPALHAHGYLLNVGTERVGLRLSLPVVYETVAQAVGQRLAAAISAGQEGVEMGVFRGPTLRLTDRWISVERLLAATTGTSLAAFVLARKAEMALRVSVPGDAPTAVFQAGAALRPLARHLSECLSLGGRFYAQQSDLNIDEPPISEQVPPGGKVALCTDLICTENTIRRAASSIAGRDADPLVIACVVDARNRRGPVQLLNRTIPVVSLTEAEVGLSESADETFIDIDPLMLQPAVPAYIKATPAEEDLLTWFAGADVLRLGHIDHPPRRHFSAFIRPQATRELGAGDQIIEAVLREVRHAFADVIGRDGRNPVTGSPLTIWHVTADGNAEELAETVQESLAADGFQVDAVTRIPRWTAGDAWVFPASLSDETRPAGVLIIHWWAITGSTLLHLVRLAAKSGASWIAAVCMLNQLDNPDEVDNLRMLRAVFARSASDGDEARSADAPSRGSTVPVSIRFVAVSRITAFSPHDCPICATRERRYQLDEDTAPPRLIKHAELLRDMLRPRELDEVARNSAADLFSVPVTAREAADYLRWRGLLRQARRTVRDRKEMIDRLRALAEEATPASEWTSVGLIRLLAAEQHWLRLPPLYFQVATELLSQVCVRSFEQLTAPLWLRVQALMVMSAAVPQRLVELLPRLLASAGNETVLVDQLLLDCCRLLRAPGHSPVDIAQLRRHLQECRNYLEEQRPAAAPAAIPTDDHAHTIRDLLTIADYRVLSKPQDPQAAWERLSEQLVRPVVRHRLEAGLLLVRNFVEDAEQVEPTPESARAAETDWDTCVRQLEERALANLPPLRPILAGDFVSDWLGDRDQRRLLTLARPDVGELRAVTDRLCTLAHGPWRPADPSWRAVRRELLDRINWWNRVFLAAHLTDHEMPALLVELIRSAPVKPATYLAKVSESHPGSATQSGGDNSQLQVFCPGKLLEQIVTHLLENIEKHRVEDATCRLHVAYRRCDQDTMLIVVRNSGTVGCTPHGHGLEALNDKLRPFGGSLRGQELTEDEWTFAAEVKLALWHGG